MPLRTAHRNPSPDNVKALLYYLNKLAGRSLKTKCIRQNIFKIEWKDKEISLIDRCHVKSACQYLSYLLNQKDFDQKSRTVNAVIADIIPYIRRLDSLINTSFIRGNSNTQPSTIHYKHAENLFYENKLVESTLQRYEYDLLVLYALRLSLEKRIHGFLGIDYILSGQRHVGLSKLFPIVKSLETIEYHDEIDWDEIEWVYKWLNHHMHRHLRPNPWVIHQAFEVLNLLILPGEKIIDKKIFDSFYAATYITDEDRFRSEVEMRVKQYISEPRIRWSRDKEVLVKKNYE